MKLALGMLFAVSGAVAGAFVWLSSTADDGGTRVRLDYGNKAGVHSGTPGGNSGSPDTAPLKTAPSGAGDPGNGAGNGSGDRAAPRRSVQVVPALLEKGPHGALPRISSDGRAAWRVYGRPYDRSDRRPRIAIIIAGLGLKRDVTESAIEDLPGVVSLAFSPYAPKLQDYAAAARKAGHELLLTLPLETGAESGVDPGPRALLTSLKSPQNRDRLHWIMGRASGYVGLIAYPIGRFGQDKDALKLVLEEARKRGILMIDGRAGLRGQSKELFGGSGVVWSRATVWLDRQPSPAVLDQAFAAAEAAARKHGAAIVIGQPYPLTLTRVRSWIETFGGKKLVAAPVSAVVRTGD